MFSLGKLGRVVLSAVRLCDERAPILCCLCCDSGGLWTWLDRLTSLEIVENLDHGLWCKILVEIIVDLDHGSSGTRTETFDFHKGEHLVVCRLAWLDAQVRCDGFEDASGTTATEHARGSGAELEEVFSDWLAVEHGVEGGYFVYTHWRPG